MYLIEILHQTTTCTSSIVICRLLYLIEILHQTTTLSRGRRRNRGLYLIEILHQTTTIRSSGHRQSRLYLIEILHQTTTATCDIRNPYCCILSKFYIKPQQRPDCLICFEVVSYRNSTSNHNLVSDIEIKFKVVSYRNSTSNHNLPLYSYWVQQVVSYRNSTSNHNTITASKDGYPLYLIEILHQTTTMAHISGIMKSCILSKFYIKPQRRWAPGGGGCRCILSKFYIKPQRTCAAHRLCPCCILSKFYIKPQLRLGCVQCLDVVSYRNSTSNHNSCA